MESIELPKVILLAGAGMSAELGVPTYWVGDDARYGAQVSQHGFTDFDHAQAGLWEREPLMQAAFFAAKTRWLEGIDPLVEGSPYLLVNQLLANREHMVITSNPDSMFKRAGVSEENLFEIHGSYRNSQCLAHPKRHGIFPTLIVDDVLRCPECGSLARPNVLFFDDFGLLEEIYRAQQNAFHAFLVRCNPERTLVVEIGAGAMVPNIRNLTLKLNVQYDLPVVRINPEVHEEGLGGFYRHGGSDTFTHLRATASEGLKLLLPEG